MLSAFKARDGKAAASLMETHLRVIEDSLNLDNKKRGAVDLVSLFSKT